jgi:hypothetical protein
VGGTGQAKEEIHCCTFPSGRGHSELTQVNLAQKMTLDKKNSMGFSPQVNYTD